MSTLPRRSFLKYLGSLSLVAVPDITRVPIKSLFPLLIPAEEIIPGTPYWYASTCGECSAGCGVMLKVRNGNVIKIEGNPNHPLNRGGLCARGQAALQEVYNEFRLKALVRINAEGIMQKLSWDTALDEIAQKMENKKSAFLSGPLSGSRKHFVERWLRNTSPESKIIIYEPFAKTVYCKANELLFNRYVPTNYHLDKADLIVSFGADFLDTWLSPVELTSKYAEKRRFNNGKSSKLIHLGISDSLTATNADEEYKIKPKSEAVILWALTKWILENNNSVNIAAAQKAVWLNSLSMYSLDYASEYSGLSRDILVNLGKLLNQKNNLVLCGDGLTSHEQGTDSIVAAYALNYILGNYGNTLSLAQSNEDALHHSAEDFIRFLEEMESGNIASLFIHNTDPLYTYPDAERFQAALRNVPLKVALCTTMTETAALADYVLPVHHWIESWGIDVPKSNIYSLVQPAISHVYESKSIEEILLSINQPRELPGDIEQFIEEEWKKIFERSRLDKPFATRWKETLLQGGYFDAKNNSQSISGLSTQIHDYLKSYTPPTQSDKITLSVTPHIYLYDGRGANKSWLWENPHPLHHTIWDIPLRIHPKLAREKSLRDGDIVVLSGEQNQIEAPVLITQDIHPSVMAIDMGAGHARAVNKNGADFGNPLQLLTTKVDSKSGDTVLLAENIELIKTDKKTRLVRLQGGYAQEERNIIQSLTSEEAALLYNKNAKREKSHHPEIYPEHKHETYDWTMVIDLSACTGCGACVTACYAENNIPIVGKRECEIGREMSWLRIEKFAVNGRSRFIPIMCQQCEQAPCETVCPVYATVHSNEGLNVQIYNRCVGTRYCSNNCPYKARRFNFYAASWPEPTDKQLNPDIYTRPKGVMEKCTFCVQRIRHAKEEAKMQGRLVADGEVMPACAQSCPTHAITFGNSNNPKSNASKLLDDFRGYEVFEHLNTKPSVIYLKGITHE